MFQQVSVLCLCVWRVDGRETGAGDQKHPSGLCFRCHLSGVPSVAMLGTLQGCRLGALVQSCSLLQKLLSQ